MKKIFYTFALCMLIVSCGSGNKKAQFNPQDRTTSKMSDEERETAIANKKAELNVNIAALLEPNKVKLSVLPPLPKGDITLEHSELVAVKLLEIVSQNGIGGVNNAPGFALCAGMIQTDKKATNTAPQKMLTTYTLKFDVINVTTGDVYASTNTEIQGAGSSFEESTLNAVKSIKNTPAIQKMLLDASKKIINWYEENLQVFKNQVESAKQQNNYALALALVESVPQEAKTAFEYSTKELPGILDKFQKGIAQKEFTALKMAISSSEDEMSPEIYAHLQMLSPDSKEFKEAEKLISQHESKIISKREKAEERKIALEEANAEREKTIELAKIEANKIKAKYEAKASVAVMRSKEYDKKGFLGTLGDRIIGALDYAGDKVDETIE